MQTENRLVDTVRGVGQTHIAMCKLDGWWKLVYVAGSLNQVFCDSLEGWDGMGGGRKVQEGGDIRIPVADSC